MNLKFGEKYNKGEKLRAGAFGEVYVAKDNTSGLKIAVKIEYNRTQQHIVH